MESGIKQKRLIIGGMTCINCQNKIERKLRNTAGIRKVTVSYSAGTADVTYDTDIISLKDITSLIENLDYQVLTGNKKQESDVSRVAAIVVLVIAMYMLLQQFGVLNLLVPGQLADTKMGYGMLFIIGLITSIHCIAMCGGINISQCIPLGKIHSEKNSPFAAFVPAFLYNLGRVISYTVIGFILGLAGLLLGGGNSDAEIPVMAQGILKLFAGVFMVIMGINILGIFPWLRKLNLRMPKVFAQKVGEGKANSRSPLLVGLLNGLMPCGPLQSMQIVALASGNPLSGALSMLLFSLGTVPLMLGLGSVVSALGKKFTQKVMQAGAVLVVVLGLAMLSQGGSLSGLLPPDLLLMVIISLGAIGIVSSVSFRRTSYRINAVIAACFAAILVFSTWYQWSVGDNNGLNSNGGGGDIQIVDGKQVVNSTLSSGSYPNITVQAGTPVKWVIDAPKGSINGCNNRMNIQEYGIANYQFKTGENVIEFTPVRTGKFQYSCWMGMIRGSINVVEVGGDTSSSTVSGDSTATDFSVTEPIPAGIVIPTDSIAVGTVANGVQTVTINISDAGISPAIVVLQRNVNTQWIINNNSNDYETSTLLFPLYSMQIPLKQGENLLQLRPLESFDFSTADNVYYGYVKVVDDINAIDKQEIKEEAGSFETLIYPPDTFQAAGGSGASCH